MNEQEILTQLRKAAEEIEIPEALKPEQIEKRLQEQKTKQQQEQQKEQQKSQQENQQPKQHLESKKAKKIIPWRRLGSMVAVLALVVCSGVYIKVTRLDKSSGTEQPEMADSVAMADTQQTAGEAGETDVTDEAERVDVASLGDMYHLASDYKEVYRTLLKGYQQNWIEGETSAETSTAASGAMDSGSDGYYYSDEAKYESADADLPEGSKEGGKDYSTTNLQMEGVDESDIAKIDGSYIYTVEDKYIVITDIRDGKLEEVTRFLPKDCGAADRVMEIYVDGDQLILVVQCYETSLEGNSKAGSDKETSDEENSDEETAASEDSAFFYEMNGKSTTQIQVYSIVDRKNPEFEGRLIQDGYYKTSRKIGDVVYLFTQYNMTSDVVGYVEKEYAAGENRKTKTDVDSLTEAVIPKVNGEQVAADGIYLPDAGESGILVASVDVNKPDKALDSKLVITGYAQTYISKDALYLYEEDYEGTVVTNIAKFALDEGKISGVAATAVSGYIRDTFAIDASDGYLRVLTTDNSTEDETNALYILDKKMKLTGQLTGIAPGEEIYAARFMGNIGYFVTYRNTDPLFTVDLSDLAKPELIGELKVTGFSEYLHFWDDTHLLGIGYESDEKTGNIENIKLSMFNIENPEEVTEEAKLVLKDVDYSEALYNYKSVIISKDKNLIGLVCENYSGSETKQTYQIYSYENGIFKKQAEIPGITGANYENIRGMYSGNVFYLWIYDNITSYDMTDGFKMLKERE